MAWMLPLAAAGGVMGFMKHQKDVSNEQADRKLASETQRYSPWTGMQAGPIKRAGSMFGDVAQGGLSGAMMGQGVDGMSAATATPAATTSSSGGMLGANTNLQEDPELISSWDKMRSSKPQMYASNNRSLLGFKPSF